MVLNRLIEIVDTMARRIINIVCIQETKWVVRKSREFEHKLFKLWYTREDKNRNGAGDPMTLT